MYKIVATLLGAMNCVFGLVWMLYPQIVLASWGITRTSSGMVVERRLGILLLVLALLLFFSRNAPHSPARSAICSSASFAAFGLAGVGLYELWTGVASSGVLPGIGFNLAFGLVFGLVEWNARREARTAQPA